MDMSVDSSGGEGGKNEFCEQGNITEALIGHNDVSGDRINIIFVGIGFPNKEEFLPVVDRTIDVDGEGVIDIDWYGAESFQNGILSIEPFKSNQDKLKFWYMEDLSCQDDICEKELMGRNVYECWPSYTIRAFVENYHKAPVGQGWSAYLRFSMVRKDDGELHMGRIGVFNHEFGHTFGKLSDVSPRSSGGSCSGYEPNAASMIQEAQERWGDLIGDGCGQDAVVDCTEDDPDFAKEIAYVAVNPNDCFDNGEPIAHCELDLQRGKFVNNDSAVKYTHLALRPMAMDECLNGAVSCVYLDTVPYCYDKKIDRLDTCDNLVDDNIYYPYDYWHYYSAACPFRASISDIMGGGQHFTSFNLVNERQLCQRIKYTTGSVGGYCTAKFGIN